MAKPAKEQKRNGYDDEDFRTVLAELDEMDDEIQELKSSVGGKIAAIKKRQQNRIKIADKELNIPPAVLRSIRKQRKLEQQMQALVDDIDEDMIEVFEDAAGQFSLFAADDGEPVKTAAESAAAKRKAEIAAASEQEQEAGEKALSELAGQAH